MNRKLYAVQAVRLLGQALAIVVLCTALAPSPLGAATKSVSKKSSSKSSSSTSKTSKKSDPAPAKKASKNPDDDDDEDQTSAAKPAHEEVVTSTTPATLASILDPLLQASARAARWGVKIVLQQTGQSLYEFNSNDTFIPASNRKLFTAALALDQLGPDFKFRSYLYRTGNIDNGTLNGNLVLKPSGDPTFSKALYNASSPDWVFKDWAQKTAQAGIKTVRGDLLIDCSAWDMNDLYPQGWATRVMQDNYAPQTSPLTLNENLITVIVNPGQKGQPGVISFSPPATGYPVINNTITGAPGGVSVRRDPNGGPITVSGGANKAGQGAELPADNPTLFAAANLRHHLRTAGVNIEGSVRIITAKNAVPQWSNDTLIAAVESPPLAEIIRYMNKRSDNHMAEQIYVSVSAAKLGRGGYTASRQLENDLLQRAGIDTRSLQVFDGSGLSEANRVSPDQICKLLNFMMTHPAAQAYFDSMAVSGRDGTLRGRMNSSRLLDKVHAKTGTINGVKCLSGYLSLDAQHTIAFSFLVNNIKGGSAAGTQDRICSILAGLQL